MLLETHDIKALLIKEKKKMEKRTEFNTALKEALKNKDKVTISTIRLILAALKDKDIAARTKGKADGIDDQEILSLLASMIKQRQDSIAAYEGAGREDLAEAEHAEIKVIHRFMPEQLTAEETAQVVDKVIEDQGASSIKDMGKVMAVLKEIYAGQVDMGQVSKIVKDKLSV